MIGWNISRFWKIGAFEKKYDIFYTSLFSLNILLLLSGSLIKEIPYYNINVGLVWVIISQWYGNKTIKDLSEIRIKNNKTTRLSSNINGRGFLKMSLKIITLLLTHSNMDGNINQD